MQVKDLISDSKKKALSRSTIISADKIRTDQFEYISADKKIKVMGKLKQLIRKLKIYSLLSFLLVLASGFTKHESLESEDSHLNNIFSQPTVHVEKNIWQFDKNRILMNSEVFARPLVQQDSFKVKINKNTSDSELQKIKEDLKENFGIEFNYTVTRNQKNQISILSLNYMQNEKNGNYQVTEENGIDEFYFYIDARGQLGIWSAAMEKRRNSRMDRKREVLDRRDRRLSKHDQGRNLNKRRESIEERLEQQKRIMDERRKQMRENDADTNISAGTNQSSSQPIYFLDGKEISKIEILEISSDEIQNVNILKDEEAIEKYGGKGLNGVIEITSKRQE